MVLQEIDADYIGRDKLVKLLNKKFGKDYSFHVCSDLPPPHTQLSLAGEEKRERERERES